MKIFERLWIGKINPYYLHQLSWTHQWKIRKRMVAAKIDSLFIDKVV